VKAEFKSSLLTPREGSREAQNSICTGSKCVPAALWGAILLFMDDRATFALMCNQRD
jgi:hypothetical protein